MKHLVFLIASCLIPLQTNAQIFRQAPEERPCGAIIIKNEFEDIARIADVEAARGRLEMADAWYQRCRTQMFPDDQEWIDIRALTAKESLSWPRTLDQAVDEIIGGLSDEDRAAVRSRKQEELIEFHRGWGMGIRNGLGLWRGNHALVESACGGKSCHPDDASMRIIEAIWVRLQNQASD